MVGEVNKIIFNMLVSGRGVYLPEIGTLYIERQGAKKIADIFREHIQPVVKKIAEEAQ